MKLSTLLVAGTMLAGLTAASAPAFADACSPGTGPSNGICNIIITFNSNGSITTTIPMGAGPTYDGSDDALIGVVNNTTHAVTGFHLNSPNNIGGFDGDGIDRLISGGPITPLPGNPDTTGYGGPLGFYTNNLVTSLDVNFANGGIAAGSTSFFSLEAPASLNTTVTPTPEPATLAVLGAGLVGLGLVRRRRA